MKRVLVGVVMLLATGNLWAAGNGLSEQEAQGKALFEFRCNICHQLPEPDMLTPKKWTRLLQLMQKRMRQADMLPLDETEFAQIHAYLASQSK